MTHLPLYLLLTSVFTLGLIGYQSSNETQPLAKAEYVETFPEYRNLKTIPNIKIRKKLLTYSHPGACTKRLRTSATPDFRS